MKTKKLIYTFSLILLFSSFITANASEKKDVTETDFVVEMDCQSCADKIKECLAFEKGVKDLKFDIENNLVTVKYDSEKCDNQKIIAALDKVGYKAEVIVKDVTLPTELNSKCGGCAHSGCGSKTEASCEKKSESSCSKEGSCTGEHK